MIYSLVIKKKNLLDYVTKLLLSYLASNILSRRHGGQPSSERAWFLHSHFLPTHDSLLHLLPTDAENSLFSGKLGMRFLMI